LTTHDLNHVWSYLAVSLTSIAGASYVIYFLDRRLRTVSYLCKLLGEQYGFVRTKYHVGYRIKQDGSAAVSTLEAVRAINAELPGLEHYSAVLTNTKHPMGNFNVQMGASEPSNTKIVTKPVMNTSNRLYYQLRFEPPVKPGSEIEYIYSVDVPAGTFANSKEELAERQLPYDYLSMKIAYPTEKIAVKIVFPKEWLIDELGFDVWLGDARLRLEKEYSRLQKESALRVRRQDDIQIAEFTVTFPILDIKYAITWRPSCIKSLAS
jgi:hypothetical protein